MKIANEKSRSRGYLVGLLGATALVLAGCNGSEDSSSAAADIEYNSPAAIAQVSADNYHDNDNGIITGATLKRWKDDWLNERPAGITGKLVILQVTEGPVDYKYIKPDNTAVYTYLVDNTQWVRTRSNGVASTVSMVLDGSSIDGLLQTHNIDPTKDMIVCAQGSGGPFNAMVQGRCWYTLRYWGVDAKHLSVLNGDNNSLETEPVAPSGHRNDGIVIDATDFATGASNTPTTPGSFSVKSLEDDNTQLQATLEDMLNILPSSDTNVLGDGVFIWDARSDTQYSGGESTTDGGGLFQNGGSRQGHPYGALQLNYSNLLEADGSYRYKEKADLASYLNGDVIADKGFRDSSYQHVGAGSAYQDGDTIYTYCETTYRAMITGIASAVVLGKPTRFYDGAMTEWNSMSYLLDATGNYLLPIDSPWRTDTKSHYVEAPTADVVPRVIDDPYAGSANAIVREDRAYKVTEDDGASSGGAPIAGSCG